MKIPFVHRRLEGEKLNPGFNWFINKLTRFGLIILFWRILIYFRWRSKLVGGKSIIFDVDYVRPYVLGGISLDFDTMSLNVRGNKISVEFLDMLTESVEGYYRFSKESGWKQVLTQESEHAHR